MNFYIAKYKINKNLLKGKSQSDQLVSYTKIDPMDSLTKYYTFGGEKIETDFPQIRFIVKDIDNFMRFDVPFERPYLLFSDRFIKILNENNITNIQYFPTTIENNKTSEIISSYKIANIIGNVECVNFEKSTVQFAPKLKRKLIKSFEKLILDESMIPSDLQIFRLGEARYLTIVSEKFKNLCNENNIVGIEFFEVLEYKFPFNK